MFASEDVLKKDWDNVNDERWIECSRSHKLRKELKQ